MEITETSSNLDRRSSQTEVWKEIDEQALRFFNEDDVPVSFTQTKEQVGDSAKIHFFDLDSTEMSSHSEKE